MADKNMVNYNQNNVNDSLTNTFEMEPMNDNQNLQKAETSVVKKKPGRGGARPNSGRKVGSTVKLSAADVLAEIAKQDVPFAVGLAQDYVRARQSGDMHVIQRYQQMLLAKVIADKTETDITSNGQTIGASFTFPTKELIDWRDA
jgi:hypothetical protein